MEYRNAGGVGPVTNLFKCCMEGGLDLDLLFCLSIDLTFVKPDLGFVASKLFSCSSLASSNAVHCAVSL